MDAAWRTLLNEIHKLGFVKGDITSLEALVSLAEGYDMNDYVEAGQAEFLEALKAAQDLLADKEQCNAGRNRNSRKQSVECNAEPEIQSR